MEHIIRMYEDEDPVHGAVFRLVLPNAALTCLTGKAVSELYRAISAAVRQHTTDRTKLVEE